MAGTASVDSLLADAISKMDGLAKRMDALEVGEKKIIKGDDDDDKKSDAFKAKPDDDDDDRRDDSPNSKGDASTAPKTKILDDAKTASKGDAAVPPSKVAGDDGELEIKHGKEKADAFPPPKKAAKDDEFPPKKKEEEKCDDDDDDKKADDDDDKKKDDAVKADAITDLRRQIADQQTLINKLQSMMKPRSDEEHAAFADAQARADGVFAGFGERAPRPLEGEGLSDYRRRLATKLKKHSSMWKGVKLSSLPDEAFGPIETQIYADATTAAASPSDLEAGELRAVTKTDPSTGVRTIVFYGKESFVKGMGRPGRRVASFRTLQSI